MALVTIGQSNVKVAAVGTRQVLASSSKLVRSIMIQANNANTGSIYVGDDAVSAPQTASISAFADKGDSVHVTVTSNGHKLENGETIVISACTNYNGTFVVSGVTTNTFDIIDTWVSDDGTGTWTHSGVFGTQLYAGNTISIEAPEMGNAGANDLDLNDFYIDASVNGEGVSVTFIYRV